MTPDPTTHHKDQTMSTTTTTEATGRDAAIAQCGPDVMVIHENEHGRYECSDYSRAYDDFLEVRTNVDRQRLPAAAQSLREIADELDAMWCRFDAARRERATAILQVSKALLELSPRERGEVRRLASRDEINATDDVPF